MTGPLNISEEEMQLFLEETEEQIQTLEDGFLRLEKGGADAEVMAAVFRAAHTVKGSSAAVGHQQMTALTHAMENILDRMRRGDLAPSRPVMDALFHGLDALRMLQAALIDGHAAGGDLTGILDELRSAAAGEAAAAGDADGGEAPAAGPGGDALERLRAGVEEGLVPLQVEITLAPDSIMPAVRAYQIYISLSEQGEVVASQPTLSEIEAEKVGERLTIYLLTQAARETIRSGIAGVSDVTGVEIKRVDVDRLGTGGQPAASTAPAPGGREEAPAGPVAGQPGATVRGAAGTAGGGAAVAENRTVRVDVAVLDNLLNLVGELVIDRTRLGQISGQISAVEGVEELATEVGRISHHLARITGSLQDEIMKARMLPIDRLFKKFPRMVRDLAQKIGKDVHFIVRGEDTELDRSVIEVIGDPLIHLLRNSVDHGLEMPEERLQAGKPRVGTVILSAYHRDNQIVVEVSDDGRGIDPDKIRESAVRKGILSPEQAGELSDREARMLIFAPGFSTAKQVSDVSGRGVGLDVVQKNIDRLNGRVELESEVGKGTTFRIHLPLTLATIRALLVRVAGQTFAVPLSAIVETLQVSPQQIQTLKRREVVVVREKVVPIQRLEHCLRIRRRGDGGDGRNLYAVLVTADGSEVGLVVDSLVGEQEIVIKNLGRFIGDVRGLAGATILGDGSLALILDVRGLREVAWQEQGLARAAG